MSMLWTLFVQKWFPPVDPTTDFTGQTILITGANVGLGLEAAKKFARNKASHIILAVRRPESGEAVVEQIRAASPSPKAITIDVWQLDVGDFKSVKALVARAEKELGKGGLDVALLNAAVAHGEHQLAAHGYERQIGVNVLGTLLLAMLFIQHGVVPSSKTDASKRGTVEIVTSGLHMVAKIDSAALHDPSVNLLEYYSKPENFGSGGGQYGLTKLLLMAPTKELAAQREDVFIGSVCPGLCATELGRERQSWGWWLFLTTFAKPAEGGARTYVSSIGQRENNHGAWFQHDAIKPVAATLQGADGKLLRKKLWNEALDVLVKEAPELAEFKIVS